MLCTELAKVTGQRALLENALLEAVLLHNRCLINFVCGNSKGERDKNDIQPADFLGRDWWPEDEQLDRQLRGRLPMLNKHLAHLSWKRVTDSTPVLWSVILVSHQTHWGMKLFTAEAARVGSTQASIFEANRDRVELALPRLGQVAETSPVLAPLRIRR